MGAWEDRTGCNAPLYTTEQDRQLAGYDLSVSWAVDYWLDAGAKPSQLTIGLGMYGRGWRLASMGNTGFNAPASGACAKGPSTGEAGYRAYYEIQAEIAAGAIKVYDEERQCPYILSGQEWVGYDDIRSLWWTVMTCLVRWVRKVVGEDHRQYLVFFLTALRLANAALSFWDRCLSQEMQLRVIGAFPFWNV